MVEIDRIAIVLHPRKPFIDWLQRVAGGESTIESDTDLQPTVVLVPLIEDEAELQAYIELHCASWLEDEFASWCSDELSWPKGRSYHLFEAYFSVRIHGRVVDHTTTMMMLQEASTLQ